MKDRLYNKKQQGDATEMLVAAELTLAGVPALKCPDSWPGYDIIAQPRGKPPQRISVKSCTFTKTGGNFIGYADADEFEWLAVVMLPGEGCRRRRIFIVPRDVACRLSYPAPRRHGRGFRVNRLGGTLVDYEDNFRLSAEPIRSRGTLSNERDSQQPG